MKFLHGYSFLSFVFILLFGVSQFFFAEKTIVNNGLGYGDGVEYAKITKEMEKGILNKKLDAYRFQRILPSILVSFALNFLRIDINTNTIVRTFQIFNLLLLLMGAAIWNLIMKSLSLSEKNKWLSFIFLFCNFAILKMTFYSPVLTDTAGFVLGIFLLHAFILKKYYLMIVLAVFGSFTWPTIFFYAAILYIFRNEQVSQESKNIFTKYLSIIICALFLLVLIVLRINKINTAGSGYQSINMDLLSISVIVTSGYLLFSIFWLLRGVNFKNLIKKMKQPVIIIRILIFIILCGVLQNIIKKYSLGGGFSGYNLMLATIKESLLKPFIFLVAHFAYFGPVIPVIVLNYQEATKHIRKFGFGMILIFFFNILLSINSESRILIAFFPFIVFFVIITIEKKSKQQNKYYIMLCIVSLLLSKIWLIIGNNLDFYFMNFGPWMSGKWYILFTILFLIVIYLLKKYFFNNKCKVF